MSTGYTAAAQDYLLGFHVMAFQLTEQIEKHRKNDEIAWLTTVTPEKAWTIPG